MFCHILALSALLALSSTVPVSEVHYSPAGAVSSQSILRHDQPPVATNFVHPSGDKIAVATPVFHAPNTVAYARTSPTTYEAHPIHYSPANLVSSQTIFQHDHPLPTLSTKLVATPGTKIAVASPLQYAPTPFRYTPVTKVITPVTKVITPVTKVIQPSNKVFLTEKHIEEYAPAKYEFSYSVDDNHSGDHKSQHEIRDGDVVHGHYTMLEANGSIRKVEYTADGEQGFNAIVSHSAPTHPHSNPHPKPTVH